MSSAEMIVAALIEVEALLIAWAIYPKIFRKSQRG